MSKTTRKPAKLGTVWVAGAKLFKNGELIATCTDTPNAIAYAINKTGADMAKNFLGEMNPASYYADRVAHAKECLSDGDVNIQRV